MPRGRRTLSLTRPPPPLLPSPLAPQIAESLRCLRHVVAGRLPMANALSTLPALDRLLHQLAGAAGRDLHRQLLRQRRLPAGRGDDSGPAGGGVAARGMGAAGAAVPPPRMSEGAAGLVPFTAASMGAAPTVGWASGVGGVRRGGRSVG